MLDRLTEIIDYFWEEYQDSTPKMKAAVIISPVLFIFVVFFLALRGCGSGPKYVDRLRGKIGFSTLVKTDENGSKWEIDLIKEQSLSDILPDVKAGEPLRVRTDIEKKGDILSIGLNVTGKAQEKYVGGSRKNGKWQEPPELRIYDGNKELIHVDKFEYG